MQLYANIISNKKMFTNIDSKSIKMKQPCQVYRPQY